MTFLITSSEVKGLRQDFRFSLEGRFNFLHDGFEQIGEGLFIETGFEGDLPSDIESVQDKLDTGFTAVKKGEGLKVLRDVFGSKPVYFMEDAGELYISDRIRPLLNFTDAEVEPGVARDYLHSGLVNHRRKTFFTGINQLRPGENLTIREGKFKITESKSLEAEKDKNAEDIVKRVLSDKIPDEKAACPVSGGLDSSIVASQAENADFVHMDFEFGSGDRPFFNEVDNWLDGDIDVFEADAGDLLAEIRDSIKVLEQPSSMIAVQAQNILFRKISEEKDFNTVIDGTGADELFYGYPYFMPFYIRESFRKGIFQGLKALKNYGSRLDRHQSKELLRVFSGGFYSNRSGIPEIEHKPRIERPETLEESKEWNLKVYDFPHILHSMEKSSEAYDLEVISCFLSEKLLEASRSSARENFSSGFTKDQLRKTFKDVLPSKIVDRKKKTGFVQIDSFPENTHRPFHEVFSSESFQNRPFFDGDMFFKNFERGFQSFFKCYRFYCFEIWMREFID